MKNDKELKVWQRGKVPNGYWKDEENVKEALYWLFEEKLDIENNNVTAKDFINYKLYGLLRKYFNNSPYEAINYMYPNKYKPWEKCSVPKGYWKDEENVKEALYWLFEEKLDIENNSNISADDFRKYGLYGLINNGYFNNSPYKAINYVYPDKYKPWEKCKTFKRYWKDEENVKEALHWLFEEKLDIENIGNIITFSHFKRYGLYGLLSNIFNGSPYQAINYMYPDKYKPWEKCRPINSYWSDEEHIKDALHWLFEEKVNIDNITEDDFRKYGLGTLFIVNFNSSIEKVIEYYKNM